jgi:hypothetical protein
MLQVNGSSGQDVVTLLGAPQNRMKVSLLVRFAFGGVRVTER